MGERDPYVEFDESGVLVNRDGLLVVGDFDIMKAVIAAWGVGPGGRQRGRVRISLWVEPKQTTNMSPDFGGTFVEPPAK